MSLEHKEREGKLSESSSSSMDEKDLDQNGYVDVQDLIKSSNEQQLKALATAAHAEAQPTEDISKLLANIVHQHQQQETEQEKQQQQPQSGIADNNNKETTSNNTAGDLINLENIILQEPDSTTNLEINNEAAQLKQDITKFAASITDTFKAEPEKTQPQPQAPPKQQQQQEIKPVVPEPKPQTTTATTTPSICSYCHCCEDLIKMIYFHPKVEEILTWKCPKTSGAILASVLVLLFSVATFSLLSLVGSFVLLAMTAIGGYRLYLAVLTRIKGHSDDTFQNLLSKNFTISKDSLQDLVKLVETYGNEYLDRFKKILLWENLTTSAIAYTVSYFAYSLGCVFDTITLLIIGVIFAFTWPKVYQIYKVPIDQAVKKGVDSVNDIISKIKEKVPMLNKKKSE